MRLALATSSDGLGSDTLVLRGHYRTRGEVGPYHLCRRFDAVGQGLGYDRFVPETAASPLRNPGHEAAFARLPEAFSSSDARGVFRKGCQATNSFLHKLIRAGLVHKVAWGEGQKGG